MKRMKLLIIDDDQNLANFLKRELSSLWFDVEVVNDGERGSYVARSESFDCIILDMNLPKKDGLEVCRDIRADGVNTPILMLTVQSSIDNKTQLLDAGVDDYLCKPFEQRELVSRIKALTRRPKEIRGDKIQIDDLIIDTNNLEVSYKDHPIELTRREYQLLEYLAKHRGSTVSKDTLLENIWDMNADRFSYTLEVHVSNLRRKIMKVAQKNYLQTYHGRGYRID